MHYLFDFERNGISRQDYADYWKHYMDLQYSNPDNEAVLYDEDHDDYVSEEFAKYLDSSESARQIYSECLAEKEATPELYHTEYWHTIMSTDECFDDSTLDIVTTNDQIVYMLSWLQRHNPDAITVWQDDDFIWHIMVPMRWLHFQRPKDYPKYTKRVIEEDKFKPRCFVSDLVVEYLLSNGYIKEVLCGRYDLTDKPYTGENEDIKKILNVLKDYYLEISVDSIGDWWPAYLWVEK